jgi:hypothetical protein
MYPKTQIGDFLENTCKDFNYISVVYVDHFFKWNGVSDILREILLLPFEAQIQNVDFVEIDFTE